MSEESVESFTELTKRFPDLCKPRTWVEDNGFLSQFGISIPGKNNFPLGYVKHFPQDFVVEEIDQQGDVLTVEPMVDSSFEYVLEKSNTYYATLVKCNLTTFEAIRQLAEQLGCDESHIQHAGIKDLRAITAQRISIRNVDPSVFKNVQSSHFFLKDIQAGKGVLQPGMLCGNRFTILIRTEPTIHEPDMVELTRRNLEWVYKNGFYNFYYTQRFSSPRYINYRWGEDILKGKYEVAVKSVLTETSPTELELFHNVRDELAQRYGNWSDMLTYVDEVLPGDVFQHERSILRYLQSHPDDYTGALRDISQQSVLWIYAFSSKSFNEQLSYYLNNNKKVPATLPLVLSNVRKDIDMYRVLLKRANFYPPNWQHIRPFGTIRLKHREVATKSHCEIEHVDVNEAGIVLQFRLKKGEYATTFLSHLFNLLGGPLAAHDTAISTADLSDIPIKTRTYFAESIAASME